MRNLRLTLIAMALFGLFSCSIENEVTPPVPQENKAIGFSNVTTRADLADIQANGFGVWAFIDNATVQNYVLMDNQEVTYDSANDRWTYSPLKYWVDDTVFYFTAAYSDDPNSQMQLIPYQENAEDPIYYIVAQSVTTDESADFDPLVATYIAKTTDSYDYNTANPVPLQFGHIMTKINFIIKKNKTTNETDTFLLDKVTISGIKNSGTYMVFPYEETEGLMTHGWYVDESSTIDYVKEFGGQEVGFAEGDEVCFSTNGLLLIPQSIGLEAVKMTFSFRYGLEGDADTNNYTAKELEVYLPSSTDLWAAGKHINYTISLSTSDPIRFEIPSIVPWGGLQTGGTIIIK